MLNERYLYLLVLEPFALQLTSTKHEDYFVNKIFYTLFAAAVLSTLAACNTASESKTVLVESLPTENTNASALLAEVLAAQPPKVQARFAARHPQQVLEFFDIQPGMTVIEALPGGGWYSKILLPYLGKKGHLIGADYAADMFPKFGFFSEEMIEGKKTWVQTWTAEAEGWRTDTDASVRAYQMNSMPSGLDGTVDAILYIRALHNLARFDNDGGYLTNSLAEAYRALKSGGIVGVVQHQAPDDASDKWASGASGYLKKQFVIDRMQDAGFEYVGSSDINQNPADQPTTKDIVWRLPPTFATSGDNPELKAKYAAIGESNRMTLKFRKP
jgi:predicted methyltransferase